MPTSDLIAAVATATGLPHGRAAELIRQAFETAIDHLLETGRLEIDGLGLFELRVRKARRGRNPRTGDRLTIPAKTVVRFQPAATINRRAAERSPEE
jgi:nucleoid DNA-binding protein